MAGNGRAQRNRRSGPTGEAADNETGGTSDDDADDRDADDRDLPPAHDEVGTRRRADDLLLMALLTGASQTQAARQAGVSERTVRRRLADPEFAARLDAERRDLHDKTTLLLMSSAAVSVRTLVQISTDPTAPATARVNAARALLHYAREYNHDAAIEARLTQIEAVVGRKQAR